MSHGLPAVAVTGAALVGLGFADGGFFPETQSWAAFACAWALVTIVFVRDELEMSSLECAFVGGLVALGAWILLSALWSEDVSAAALEAERALLYALAATVVVLVAGRVGHVLGGTLLGVAVVVVSALVHYLFLYGERLPDAYQGYLLFRPVGYANALGALAALGAVLAVGVSMHARQREVRALSCASLVPFAASLVLTDSRGAWLALGIALSFLVVLDSASSWPALALGALGFGLAAALGARADLQRSLPHFDATGAERLGVSLAALTAAVVVAAWLLPHRPDRRRSRRVSVAVGLATGGAVLAIVAVVAAGLLDLSPRDRREYWRAAWGLWQESPLGGGGAGSFGRGADSLGALDAHSLYLETLAELGVVGLALLAAVLVVPGVAAARAGDRVLLPTALAGYVVFLVHAGVDWDWEMPVVTLGGLFCATALLVAAPGESRMLKVRTKPWPLVVSLVVLTAAAAALARTGAVELGL